MRDKADRILEQFERTIDEFFNELLIDRWRCGTSNRFEQAEVIDRADHYELRLFAEGVDPEHIDVESLGQKLTIRAPMGPNRKLESSFKFAETVDSEAATARWANKMLTIILPKKKARRIRLKDS